MTMQSNGPLTNSPLDAAIAERDASIMEMVREALCTKNVMLAYQPIVNCKNTEQVAFYEGLLRIMDSAKRIIPAKDFIDTIETQEEGRLMDCLSLEFGLQTLAEHPDIRLSVNMSARSILYEPWSHILDHGLNADPTIAERLIIEITESSAMDMPEAVTEFMARLHAIGVSFALDDFGAGYTAFRHFKDFYFDIVKIDAGFIRHIDRDGDNQVLTGALASIAQQFDMFTVAEGVERPEEAEYLIRSGIDCLQGYLFGAPKIRPSWLRSDSVRRAG